MFSMLKVIPFKSEMFTANAKGSSDKKTLDSIYAKKSDSSCLNERGALQAEDGTRELVGTGPTEG
jgi:hypothetical protein